MFLKKCFRFIIVLFLFVFDLSAQGLDSFTPSIDTIVDYGGFENDCGYSVEKVPGGYIVCGYTESYGSGGKDVYLIKTNGLDSIPRWEETFGGFQNDCAYSLQITDDGGYVICGYTESYGSGGQDVYLIKTDSLGDTLWTKTFGGSEDDCGYSVDITDDGGYVICGYTESFAMGRRDIYLIKTDSSGDSLWTKTFSGQGAAEGFSVKQTRDKGYICTGQTTFEYGTSTDIYILKADSLGDTLWSRAYGGYLGWDGGHSVIETSDGGYVIAGDRSYPPAMSSGYLLKTDLVGDTLWSFHAGGGYLNSVIETENHDYVVTGGNWASEAIFAEVDSTGNPIWLNYIGDEFAG